MKHFWLIFLVLTCFLSCEQSQDPTTTVAKAAIKTEKPSYALALHGGAGTILKKNMSEEKEVAIRKKLNEALTVGEDILKAGGKSMDAIVAVISLLEDSEHFNAGKGAVFTNAGTNEMDASIMDGESMEAGAVAGVTIIKNPITAAKAVLENSPHVMLSGSGADQFGKEQGLKIVAPDYFKTDRRLKSLEKVKATEKQSGSLMKNNDHKFGTVGCAALDKHGNLAAGTSTGGMTNKRYGRIGDSPIIGAGTYANNATCAISCTGHGEFFIRYAVAHDVSAMMEYKEVSFQEAASEVINGKLKRAGGDGGLIGVDKDGNIAMPFNTAGMYRGFVKPGERKIDIYGEE